MELRRRNQMYVRKHIRTIPNMKRDMFMIKDIVCHGSRALKCSQEKDLRIHAVGIASYMGITYIVGLMGFKHPDCLLDNLRIDDRAVTCNLDNDISAGRF